MYELEKYVRIRNKIYYGRASNSYKVGTNPYNDYTKNQLYELNKILVKSKENLEIELNKKDCEMQNIIKELKSQYKQELMEQADKLETINNELYKKDKLNKRLVNILTIYKYHELNNVKKYNYEEIKEKNKKLNNEFKIVAKLMKLNK